MSDQGYTAQENPEEEDGGIFCQSCSPLVRKIGYYLTFLAGVIIFVVGIIDLITLSVIPLIIGSLVSLLSPLWIKSPKRCVIDMKNPLRLTSFIFFIGFLVATIVSVYVIESTFVTIIFGVFLAIAGIWYFLSFFKNGQKACIACIKACCSKSENQQSQPS